MIGGVEAQQPHRARSSRLAAFAAGVASRPEWSVPLPVVGRIQWTSQVSTDGQHLIDTNPDQRIGPY